MTTEPRISGQDFAAMELFAGLPHVALHATAAAARCRCLSAGTRLFNQGDENVRAHVVIEGSVRISQSGSDGAQIVVRFIAAGEIFGAVALFTDGRYPADATTIVPTIEASWSDADLRNLMIQHPQLAINALRIIGGRLQDVQNRVRELATQRVERRIAHALMRLARQAGHSSVDGTAIGVPLRRKDVADIAGTTLHTASRILAAWETAGLVSRRHRQLIIRRPIEVLKIAEAATD